MSISWRTRWRIYEYVRNSLWLVPALFVLLAWAMGAVIPDIDESVDVRIGLSYGPEAARAVLAAMAGGMITFTGFVFSILLVAVQFGSSQFSPRLLRHFLRDPTTKVALGVFMATFIYALQVLRVVGTGEDESFVPSNSVSISVGMLMLSMVMFLLLINRITHSMRVSSVLHDVGRDAYDVIDRVYRDPVGGDDADPQPVVNGPARTVLNSGRLGILQSVDFDGLVDRAAAAGTVIELVPAIGEQVGRRAPLFRVAEGGEEIEDEWLQGAVAVGDERTMRQDPAFGLRLLADVSAKALSPAVNDPTTAIQALDQIEELLRELGVRRLRPGIGRDAEGTPRFLYPAPSWEDFLSLALDETRHYGAGSIQVNRRLRALLTDLREAVPESRRAAVDGELELLGIAADTAFTPGDRRTAAAGDRQGLGGARAAV